MYESVKALEIINLYFLFPAGNEEVFNSVAELVFKFSILFELDSIIIFLLPVIFLVFLENIQL